MSDEEAFDLPTVPEAATGLPGTIELGAFSISFTVADLGTNPILIDEFF